MNEEKFSFELLDRYTPEVVIKNSLEQIEQATKGHVIGNIARYDGPIYSYTKTKVTGLAAALGTMQTSSETVTVDIQQDLGEQNSEQNKFEVFLTVKGLEHYKYRMMFVKYSTISYPVTIVMNEDLAIEYSGKKKDIFTIASMKKLEELMDIVLNSETMILLIQSLINESLRQAGATAGVLP
ncbi:MAG: hypothetical protein K2G51_07930 [Lachnospiraceae bacterium]|nr:hypothetical protein [Lachnospiraceae bacterium]MDE7273704.1 hypothetical protein [Lachnospiraceae bacterium]